MKTAGLRDTEWTGWGCPHFSDFGINSNCAILLEQIFFTLTLSVSQNCEQQTIFKSSSGQRKKIRVQPDKARRELSKQKTGIFQKKEQNSHLPECSLVSCLLITTIRDPIGRPDHNFENYIDTLAASDWLTRTFSGTLEGGSLRKCLGH